jgi:hypothetical protein
MMVRPGIKDIAPTIEDAILLPPFLNRDILKPPTKTPGKIRLPVRKDTTNHNEMNAKTLDIDMNLCDNTRSVIRRISFHQFHG